LYVAKGLSEDDASRMAGSILSNSSVALDTMAREELGIDPELRGTSPWKAAGSSFALCCVGAIVPILPYFFVGGTTAVVASAALSAIALFGIGAAITLVTGASWLRSGLRQVVFGIAAATVTFAVGRLLGTAVGVIDRRAASNPVWSRGISKAGMAPRASRFGCAIGQARACGAECVRLLVWR
jgi:vacuolar iron transporter family protein